MLHSRARHTTVALTTQCFTGDLVAAEAAAHLDRMLSSSQGMTPEEAAILRGKSRKEILHWVIDQHDPIQTPRNKVTRKDLMRRMRFKLNFGLEGTLPVAPPATLRIWNAARQDIGNANFMAKQQNCFETMEFLAAPLEHYKQMKMYEGVFKMIDPKKAMDLARMEDLRKDMSSKNAAELAALEERCRRVEKMEGDMARMVLFGANS